MTSKASSRWWQLRTQSLLGRLLSCLYLCLRHPLWSTLLITTQKVALTYRALPWRCGHSYSRCPKGARLQCYSVENANGPRRSRWICGASISARRTCPLPFPSNANWGLSCSSGSPHYADQIRWYALETDGRGTDASSTDSAP